MSAQSNIYEDELLKILESDLTIGRGSKSSIETTKTIESLVDQLELVGKNNYFINNLNPTANPYLDGCWKLLYTSSPGTNSPIQRTFTAIDKGVNVYQVVNVVNPKGNEMSSSFLGSVPDVSNTICFGDGVRLRVTAIASTNSNKLIEPRKNDGKIFGLNIFGISSTSPPRDPNERIDFSFQEAKLEFKNSKFSLPYPVPFKLLGDEAKGWIDITYISPTFRISRGNKGTLFLLKKVNKSDNDKYAELACQPINMFSANNNVNVNKSTKTTSIILFPAQLGIAEDYDDLKQAILKQYNSSNLSIYAAPLQRLDWIVGLVPSFFSKEYFQGELKPNTVLKFYFDKVDQAVSQALSDNPNTEIVILAHSIGGWIARAWLSEWVTKSIKSKVKGLVTLGSPHLSPPPNTIFAEIDQTRGLLSYINKNYPGAFEKSVKYVSVIGSGVEGELRLLNLESFLAYTSYLALCGNGKSVGDGIIPLEASKLNGAEFLILEDTKHSNFVPTPGKSLKLPLMWYGSPDILPKWLEKSISNLI